MRCWRSQLLDIFVLFFVAVVPLTRTCDTSKPSLASPEVKSNIGLTTSSNRFHQLFPPPTHTLFSLTPSSAISCSASVGMAIRRYRSIAGVGARPLSTRSRKARSAFRLRLPRFLGKAMVPEARKSCGRNDQTRCLRSGEMNNGQMWNLQPSEIRLPLAPRIGEEQAGEEFRPLSTALSACLEDQILCAFHLKSSPAMISEKVVLLRNPNLIPPPRLTSTLPNQPVYVATTLSEPGLILHCICICQRGQGHPISPDFIQFHLLKEPLHILGRLWCLLFCQVGAEHRVVHPCIQLELLVSSFLKTRLCSLSTWGWREPDGGGKKQTTSC